MARRRILSIALLSGLFVFLTVSLGGALPAKADVITISPPRFELFGNPGDLLTEKVKVSNDSAQDLDYQAVITDFRALGDAGEVDFVDPSETKDTFSLARWITFEPSQFTIPANQERIVNITIRVPRNAEPGGHYGSLIVRRIGEGTAGGQTSVESRVGSLILMRISGDIQEKLTLESFNASSGYQQTGPIEFNMRYKNEGNVHVAPTGTIVITNIFGKKVKEIPLSPTNVLPEADRIIKAKWDDKTLVGRYTASLVISYGQSKQAITSSTSFIVFPVWLAIVIVALLVLVYLMITKRKHLKRLINNLTRE